MTGGRYSVFGADGFVGSEIVRRLEAKGAHVLRVTRDTWPESGASLGHVIYAIGITADFRSRLVETFELHLVRLHETLSRYRFDSFTYLSSTRVYTGAASTHEAAALTISPADPDHVYNISKIAGESLCLALGRPDVRVVRLSNVVGAGDDTSSFLASVLRDLAATGGVRIQQSPGSSKDYIALADAAEAIITVAGHGSKPIYNIASGTNITHQKLVDVIRAAGYSCHIDAEGPTVIFPVIDLTRFEGEFGRVRSDPVAVISALVAGERVKGGQI